MLSSCILSYGPFDVQPDTLGHCFINQMHSRGVIIRQVADIQHISCRKLYLIEQMRDTNQYFTSLHPEQNLRVRVPPSSLPQEAQLSIADMVSLIRSRVAVCSVLDGYYFKEPSYFKFY